MQKVRSLEEFQRIHAALRLGAFGYAGADWSQDWPERIKKKKTEKKSSWKALLLKGMLCSQLFVGCVCLVWGFCFFLSPTSYSFDDLILCFWWVNLVYVLMYIVAWEILNINPDLHKTIWKRPKPSKTQKNCCPVASTTTPLLKNICSVFGSQSQAYRSVCIMHLHFLSLFL